MRKPALLTLITLFAVAIGAGLWLLVDRGTGGTNETDRAGSVESTSIQQANIRLIEHALDSSKPQIQATALAPLAREVFLQHTQPMLPTGVTVVLAPATFKASGNAAAIKANTSNGHTFTLRLIAAAAHSGSSSTRSSSNVRDTEANCASPPHGHGRPRRPQCRQARARRHDHRVCAGHRQASADCPGARSLGQSIGVDQWLTVDGGGAQQRVGGLRRQE